MEWNLVKVTNTRNDKLFCVMAASAAVFTLTELNKIRIKNWFVLSNQMCHDADKLEQNLELFSALLYKDATRHYLQLIASVTSINNKLRLHVIDM